MMRKLVKDTYCSYCGCIHIVTSYPRQCGACMGTTYANPCPVAVTLIPANGGLVVIRRALEGRGQGLLAFPGGYQNLGESWQEACAREALEEAGLAIDPAKISLFDAKTDPRGIFTMIYGLAPRVEGYLDLSSLKHDREVSEIAIIDKNFGSLAFSTHTEVATRYFHPTEVKQFELIDRGP